MDQGVGRVAPVTKLPWELLHYIFQFLEVSVLDAADLFAHSATWKCKGQLVSSAVASPVNLRSLAPHHFMLPGLTALRLDHCSQPHVVHDRFMQTLCSHISTLRELSMQHCTQAGLTDASLRCIARTQPQLHTIRLSGCTQVGISNAGICALSTLAALSHVDLSGCDQPTLGDGGLVPLAEAGHLQTLLLSKCSQRTITDRSVQALCACTSLTYLAFDGCAHPGVSLKGTALLEQWSQQRHPAVTLLLTSGVQAGRPARQTRAIHRWRASRQARRRRSRRRG